MATPTRSSCPERTLVGTPPSFEASVAALMGDRPDQAIAMFAARVLADPTDWSSRANHAFALYHADRWSQAVDELTKLIPEVGPAHLHAGPMLFSIGFCLLQLDDPWGSLISTTTFLDYSNERHPLYADALTNTACAWEQLGAVAEARTLRGTLDLRALPAIDATKRRLMRRLWSRRQVIATSHRILGLSAKPRPAPRRCSWTTPYSRSSRPRGR
jgi:tetratricopeptide (TPR) repeat protein